jgi:PAS domain S-box-containing protein
MRLAVGIRDRISLAATRLGGRTRAGIALKLWGAFGAIIAIYFALAAAVAVNLAALRDDLDHVTTVAEPLSAAAYEMEINVIGSGMGVLKYLDQPNPAFLARVAEDRAEFENFHAQYMRLAPTVAARRLGEEVRRIFNAYSALGDELIDAKNREIELFGRMSESIRAFGELLDGGGPGQSRTPAPGGDVDAALRFDVRELLALLDQYARYRRREAVAPLPETAAVIQRGLDRVLSRAGLARQVLPPGLQQAAAGLPLLARDILATEKTVERAFPEFIALRRELDDLLDDEIQILTRARLQTRSEDAHRQVAAAILMLAAFGAVTIVTALAATAYLSRHVVGPVRELAQAATFLGHGRFDHRVRERGNDEFGELAGAFNRMAAMLEETTSEREARYRAVIDRVADGILIVADDGRVIDRNPAAVRLFGSVLENIVDCPVDLLLEPAANSGQLPGFDNAPAWLAAVGRDALAVGASGTTVPVELSFGVFGRPGEPICVVLVRDVTEHKETLAALERKGAELARSNADLEQFAYVATHDMQEPLRAVAGYCSLLKRRYGQSLEGEGQRLIANAIDGVKRLQALIEDLLQFSQVGRRAGAPEPTNAGEALRRALRNLELVIAESNAVVTFDDLPAVMVDSGELVQVFQNLVGNAIKYRGAAPPRIHVGADQRPDRVELAVSDNGMGIAPEHHDRVFGAFQRLHSRDEYPGTGIGLAICKKIVERHNGRIWLQSRSGEGCTVRFTLPAQKAMAA